MHDCRKRIDGLAVHEQIQFDQFRRPIASVFVIHRPVTARDALYLVVEIDQDFVERQFAVQHHPARIERFGALHLAAFLQNQSQNVTDVFVRTEHICFYDWLTNLLNHTRIWQVSRIVDQEFFSARGQNLIHNAWTRRDDVHVVFAAEPFLDDLHMK